MNTAPPRYGLKPETVPNQIKPVGPPRLLKLQAQRIVATNQSREIQGAKVNQRTNVIKEREPASKKKLTEPITPEFVRRDRNRKLNQTYRPPSPDTNKPMNSRVTPKATNNTRPPWR